VSYSQIIRKYSKKIKLLNLKLWISGTYCWINIIATARVQDFAILILIFLMHTEIGEPQLYKENKNLWMQCNIILLMYKGQTRIILHVGHSFLIKYRYIKKENVLRSYHRIMWSNKKKLNNETTVWINLTNIVLSWIHISHTQTYAQKTT
jgi:hypothetical protein